MWIRAFCFLLLMNSGTSYAGLFGDDKAREQINTLREQVETLEARIAKMEAVLNNQGLLELYSQMETFRIEQNKLRGQIEMLTNDSVSLQKRQKDFYIDLDSRLRLIEDPNAPLPTYSDPEKTDDLSATPPEQSLNVMPVPPSSGTIDSVQPIESIERTTSNEIEHTQQMASTQSTNLQTTTGTTEKESYDAAHRLFINGDYLSAKSQFESFLQQFPQSELAPSAAYWIGNVHYALRDFQDAIKTQQNLINNYPDSPKVPDALLNIASSQSQLADKKAAKKTLEDLIARFPFSNAAEKARQRLNNP